MGSQPTNLKLARSVSFCVANCNSPKVMGHLSAALLALALAGGLGGLTDATCAIGGDGSGKVSCQEGSTYSQTCATPIKNKSSWTDAEEALRDALEMEKVVTGAMKAMIDQCSDDDFSADWLTGDWLDEQLRGQRELSGMINTFATFRRDYESLADWMFSEQLLKA